MHTVRVALLLAACVFLVQCEQEAVTVAEPEVVAPVEVVAKPKLPPLAWEHEALLIKWALVRFGHELFVPALAAQIEQESYWRAEAVSHAKARGPSQFVKSTAEWVAPFVDSCTVFEDFHDFFCAIPAQTWLMKFNLDRSPSATECDQFAFGLAMYNGGGVKADRQMAEMNGYDPNRWFGHTELFNGRHRTAANFKENRGYPRKILRDRQPRYVQAGYGGGYHVCLREFS